MNRSPLRHLTRTALFLSMALGATALAPRTLATLSTAAAQAARARPRGEVTGVESPVGVLPTAEELNLEGMSFEEGDLEKLLSIDVERWCQEMKFREEHLDQFNLPDEIWEAHRRVVKALEEARG